MASPRIKPEKLPGSSGSPFVENETITPRATDALPDTMDHDADGPKIQQPQLDMKPPVPASSIPDGSPVGNKRDFSAAFPDPPQSSAENPPPVNTIIVSEGGDLEIDVHSIGDGPRTKILVSSRRLAEASSYFETWLFGNATTEPKPEKGPWIKPLRVPGVKAQPLIELLNIAHGNFSKVNKYPTLPQLHEILCVTQALGLLHLVNLVANQWWKGAVSGLPHPWSGPAYRYLLSVSYELGDKEVFDKVTSQCLKWWDVDESGQVPKKYWLTDPSDPRIPGLVEIMAARRLVILQTTLDRISKKIDDIISKGVITIVSDKPHAEACNSMIAGSIIRGLSKEGLFPVPTPGSVRISLGHFERKLRAAASSCQKDWAYLTVPPSNTFLPKVHWANAFTIWLNDVMHDSTTKATEGCMQEYYGHLEAQAAISGIDQGPRPGGSSNEKKGDGK